MHRDECALRSLIYNQFVCRSDAATPIKVNLYKGYELDAVCEAFARFRNLHANWFPDCFMVADSYLTSHLGRLNTRLAEVELDLFFHVFLGLVKEVRIALDRRPDAREAYLIADLPDGIYTETSQVIERAKRLLDYGAECIKLEIAGSSQLRLLDALSRAGIVAMAHVGYTPQHAENRTYGVTRSDSQELFALARSVRDAGAAALVLERVSHPVNIALSKKAPNSLPTYAIFSGVASNGGISLNAWDSVVKPPFQAKRFPPTASISHTQVGELYRPELISQSFHELLHQVKGRFFPLPPMSATEYSDANLEELSPWRDD